MKCFVQAETWEFANGEWQKVELEGIRLFRITCYSQICCVDNLCFKMFTCSAHSAHSSNYYNSEKSFWLQCLISSQSFDHWFTSWTLESPCFIYTINWHALYNCLTWKYKVYITLLDWCCNWKRAIPSRLGLKTCSRALTRTSRLRNMSTHGPFRSTNIWHEKQENKHTKFGKGLQSCN